MNVAASPRRSHRYYVLLAILAAILLTSWLLVGQNLNLEQIQNIARETREQATTRPFLVFSALAVAQMLGMMFSMPTKGLLTILGGALLGTILGAASTFCGVFIGTSVLFFVSRYLLREKVLRLLVGKLGDIEQRMSERPIRTMIGLRLFIVLPYGPCTIGAALSSMRYRDFLLGSAIGDFPVVVLYTIAGERLFALTSSSEALDPSAVATLIALGCLFLAWALFSRGKRSLVGTPPPPTP